MKVVAAGAATEPSTPNNCVAEGVELWQEKVGHVEHGKFGKLLKPSVERHGWDGVLVALKEYLQHPGVKRVEWFAQEVVKWIEEAKIPRCWGANANGQLGAATSATCGALACSPSPAPRVGTFVFASLALGASHSPKR